MVRITSFVKKQKCKIMLISNSQLPDYAVNIKTVINNKVEVLSVVKPGSRTGPIQKSAKNDIVKLTKEDVLIICSAINDMEHKNSITAYNQIVNFISRLSHTNIILMSVPLRYDLPNLSLIHRETESFSRKLMELKQRFSYVNFLEIIHIRHWFTSHGLHLNKAGRELLANELSYLDLSLFEDPVNSGCHSE